MKSRSGFHSPKGLIPVVDDGGSATTLERMAEAIYEDQCNRHGLRAPFRVAYAFACAEAPHTRKIFEAAARAALLAIRDVPASLVEAASKEVFGPSPLPHEVSNFDGGWVSLIDAILGETGNPSPAPLGTQPNLGEVNNNPIRDTKG